MTRPARDGHPLFVQSWLPEGAPRAVVCLVHGLGEHSGRYQHVAEFLCRNGLALVSFDLRGHGQSAGKRGHVDSFAEFMDDIEWIVVETRAQFPDLPCFLYGHSLGGILVLNFVLRYRPNLQGAVVTSSGLRTVLEKQKLKLFLARLGERFLPDFSLPTGLDPKLLSHDPQIVHQYIADELVHDRATFRMACVTLDAIPYVFAEAGRFSLPLLVMHGDQDSLAYKNGSQEFVAAVLAGEESNKDVTLKLWEGLYHETHNELEKDEVLAYLVSWIEMHL